MAGELEILRGSTRLIHQSEAPDSSVSQNERDQTGPNLSVTYPDFEAPAAVTNSSGPETLRGNHLPEKSIPGQPPLVHPGGQGYETDIATKETHSHPYEVPQASGYDAQPYAQSTLEAINTYSLADFDFAQGQSFLMDLQGDDNSLAALTHLPADGPLFAGSLNSPSMTMPDAYNHTSMYANLANESTGSHPETISIEAYDMAAWQLLMNHASLGSSIMDYNPFPDPTPSSSSA